MSKTNSGRPKVLLSKEQKELTIQYVKTSGLYKNRLAAYLCISRKTLYRLLERDNDFDTRLQRADAEFCANLIQKAKPEFILKTRYSEEFNEENSAEMKRTREIDEYFSGVKKLMKD